MSKPGSTLYTDEHPSYTGLKPDYWHFQVNHSAGEYVRWFFIHVNGIEGAWGLFKRQIYGIHHWVSEKHLQAYLDEMCYRYNRREMGEGERVNDLLDRISGRRLTYKAPIHEKDKDEIAELILQYKGSANIFYVGHEVK